MQSIPKEGSIVRERWISEIIRIASRLPNVELKYLLWFARAFDKLIEH